jgi:flagellar protein FlaG
MQISATQIVSGRPTTDRADNQPQDTIQDRTRQDHVRRLAQAAKAVNDSGQIGTDKELTIALDRGTGQPVIRLIDRQTREVIHQIPGERVLRMAEEFKREAAQKADPGGTDWLSTLG